MGSMLNRLATLGAPVYAGIFVAIFIVSMPTVEYFLCFVYAINTMDSGKPIWEYIFSRLRCMLYGQ